jgi:hypothetical protein
MNPSTVKRVSPTVRCVLGLAAVFAPMMVMAMERPVSRPAGPPPIVKLLAEIAPKAAPVPVMELVWKGADIDGDGGPDFANPTGEAPRGHDGFGDGWFGARRDGGSRDHEGVDYIASAGQDVQAPMSGYVTKIGYAYAGDTDLKFVEITNPALGYAARAFYVIARRRGRRRASAWATRSARSRACKATIPGITNHVHLEILAPGGDRVNAARLIQPKMVAKLETTDTAAD